MSVTEEVERARDPIWVIFRHRHLQYIWLAERTGYSLQYIRDLAAGRKPASDEFRRRATFAMDLPEKVLFQNDAESASA